MRVQSRYRWAPSSETVRHEDEAMDWRRESDDDVAVLELELVLLCWEGARVLMLFCDEERTGAAARWATGGEGVTGVFCSALAMSHLWFCRMQFQALPP